MFGLKSVDSLPDQLKRKAYQLAEGDDAVVSATNSHYYHWLEDNAAVLYPSVALVVVALVIIAAIFFLGEARLDLETRVLLRKRVIHELQLSLDGLSPKALALRVGIPKKHVIRALEDLGSEGLVVKTVRDKKKVWRVCGSGPESHRPAW